MSTIARMNLAAQQAVAVKQPTADPTDDSKDDHHDHDQKKDPDSAASSDSNPDAAAIAGQLTPQAITAIKQTSDQPNPRNSPQDQTENQDDTQTASPVAQASTATKTRPREVHAAKAQAAGSNAQSPDPAASPASAQPTDVTTPDNTAPPKPTGKTIDDVLNKSAAQGLIESPTTPRADPLKTASSAQPPQRPEVHFAETNHPAIVSEIQGKLLPNGGSMDIHLTPQDLGSVHVRVEVRDGSITATFQAADDQTAKLLSHSLSDLKTSLEAQGITVEKLHVTHAPHDQQPSQNNNTNNRDPDRQQQQAFHQEQQRRDLMRRMWRRMMKNQDPLDLVA